MVIVKKATKEGEKDWENPTAPEKISDARDDEQMERQHREAKRRHDNLTENQEEQKDQQD